MSEQEKDPEVLVCLQVREDTITSVLPGATQDACGNCGHRVWISRSGQAMMASQKVVLECLECTMGRAESRKELLEKAQPVAGAFTEIAEVMRGLHESG